MRVDNAGEWNDLEAICTALGIKFEQTAPHTPEQNPFAERQLPAVRNQAYAALLASTFDEEERQRQWANSLMDATINRNLITRKNWSNAYEPFGEDPPVRPEHLIPFGAVGWMAKRDKLKPKFAEKAIEIKRVGYAENHSSDTYIVQNQETMRCVKSRDITWKEKRRYDSRDPNKEDDEDKLVSWTDDVKAPAPSPPTPPKKSPPPAPVSDGESDSDDDSTSSSSSDGSLGSTHFRRMGLAQARRTPRQQNQNSTATAATGVTAAGNNNNNSMINLSGLQTT